MPAPAEVCASAEAVFRREHGRIIASLIRLCGSFDRAEEAMQEAFAAALHHWAERGVPDNPAAWITTAAYRKLIDARRRDRTRRETNSAGAGDRNRGDRGSRAAGGVVSRNPG
jgi:RNA polymerase sigma-70 factor (ECF subfamily)